jgi:Clathrin adaptor complex small chain
MFRRAQFPLRTKQRWATQIIHHFVEVLDRYFGNVCELDLIFNFHKV